MEPNAISEKELLSLIAKGDENAFRQLVDSFWQKVYINTLSLVKNSAKAQEITQDIFYKIWTKREMLTDVRNFMSFVYVVGRNQVISEMRKKLMEPVSIDSIDFMIESRHLPELELNYKETWSLINNAINKMPPRQQEVFRLSRITGLSNNEIAEKLGLSLAAVKWHIVAGLNTLRTHLSEHTSENIFIILILSELLLQKQVIISNI